MMGCHLSLRVRMSESDCRIVQDRTAPPRQVVIRDIIRMEELNLRVYLICYVMAPEA
jgi:hypothetical protein